MANSHAIITSNGSAAVPFPNMPVNPTECTRLQFVCPRESGSGDVKWKPTPVKQILAQSVEHHPAMVGHAEVLLQHVSMSAAASCLDLACECPAPLAGFQPLAMLP